MERDVKEVVGVLMRLLDGGETSADELQELGFEAAGELQAALNTAYIKLLEFCHDRELRLADQNLDRRMRLELQEVLDRIVKAYDAQIKQ
jgi:hypothetical protein